MNDLPNLIEIMLQNVCHSSPVLSFYSGKGVGLLIKSLCEVGYTERGKTQVLAFKIFLSYIVYILSLDWLFLC